MHAAPQCYMPYQYTEAEVRGLSVLPDMCKRRGAVTVLARCSALQSGPPPPPPPPHFHVLMQGSQPHAAAACCKSVQCRCLL